MPSYLVIHAAGQKKDDILIEDDDLTLTFQAAGLSSRTLKAPALPFHPGKAPASNASTRRRNRQTRLKR
ncbi:hypothetical protein ACFQ51_52785 [Streptomyces kaempferi]